jgi:hypothetical protein
MKVGRTDSFTILVKENEVLLEDSIMDSDASIKLGIKGSITRRFNWIGAGSGD